MFSHTLRAAESDAFDASCISDLAINNNGIMNNGRFGLWAVSIIIIAFCTCRSTKPTLFQQPTTAGEGRARKLQRLAGHSSRYLEPIPHPLLGSGLPCFHFIGSTATSQLPQGLSLAGTEDTTAVRYPLHEKSQSQSHRGLAATWSALLPLSPPCLLPTA